MHAHGTVQPNGSGHLTTCLLPLACPGVQRAEAEVTVHLERTHTEFLGQGEGLAVVGCSGFHLWGIAVRMELTEEPQGVGFVAPVPSHQELDIGERLATLGAEGGKMCIKSKKHVDAHTLHD